jgi:hypothetical protein
MNFN